MHDTLGLVNFARRKPIRFNNMRCRNHCLYRLSGRFNPTSLITPCTEHQRHGQG